MATQQLKELLYDGKKVVVEVAKRDGQGKIIHETYAKKENVMPYVKSLVGTTTLSTLQTTYGEEFDLVFGDASNSDELITLSVRKEASGQNYVYKYYACKMVNEQPYYYVNQIATTAASSTTIANILSASNIQQNSVASERTYIASSTAISSYVASHGETSTAIAVIGLSTQPYIIRVQSAGGVYNVYISEIAGPNSWKVSAAAGTSTFADIMVDGNKTTFVDTTYLSSNVYTKAEVNTLLGNINQFEYVVESSLPTAAANTMYKIYLIPSTNAKTQNAKDEFITLRSGTEGSYTYTWEQIGTTTVDLTNYISADANLSSNKIVLGDGNKKVKDSGVGIVTSSTGLTNSDTDIVTSKVITSELAKKQDALTAGNGITIATENSVLTISSVITATDVTLDF